MSGKSEQGASGPECGGCRRLHREPSEHDLCGGQEAQGNIRRVHESSVNFSQLSIEEEGLPSAFQGQTMFSHDSGVIPEAHGAHSEEQGNPSSVIVKMYDQSPYPWLFGDYSLKVFPKENYEENCPDVDAMERIQFHARPKEFQGSWPDRFAAREIDAFYKCEVRLNTSLDVDVVFLRPDPLRRVCYLTPSHMTWQDIIAQSRLASASVDFTLHDDTSLQTTEQQLKVTFRSDHETVVRHFVTQFNKDIHTCANIRNTTMPDEDRAFLQNMHTYIIDNVSNPKRLSRELFTENVLTREDLDEFDGLKTAYDKIDAILLALPRRGNVLEAFIKALRKKDHKVAVYLMSQHPRL